MNDELNLEELKRLRGATTPGHWAKETIAKISKCLGLEDGM